MTRNFFSLVGVGLTTVFLFLRYQEISWTPAFTFLAQDSSIPSEAANATLGFGAVLVLTTDSHTWRVEGLRKAAEAVGITLTIPDHGVLKEMLVQNHNVDLGVEGRGSGSYQAALGHVALLDHFLALDVETALILEDDADFGLNIREQMSAFSDAIWEDFNSLRHHHTRDPYKMASWDVLWLG